MVQVVLHNGFKLCSVRKDTVSYLPKGAVWVSIQKDQDNKPDLTVIYTAQKKAKETGKREQELALPSITVWGSWF